MIRMFFVLRMEKYQKKMLSFDFIDGESEKMIMGMVAFVQGTRQGKA